MIRLHRVCKVFEGGPMKLPALSDISFTVDKGDFVVLSGASGAGKTTLLRLLYADERASDGEIEVAGFDVTTLRRRDVPLLRRSLGIVFQDAKLLSRPGLPGPALPGRGPAGRPRAGHREVSGAPAGRRAHG